jgi:peptide deformylase
MAILKVARMGHPVLRQVAQPIPPGEIGSAPIRRLISNMLETVCEYSGIGLAAPQVHASVRLVLLALDPEDGFEVWINPVLTPEDDTLLTTEEGCLSIPGLRGDVTRPATINVTGLDQNGEAFSRRLTGFPAVVAQHECDHLDGVLYIDKADPKSLSFLEEARRYGAGEEE